RASYALSLHDALPIWRAADQPDRRVLGGRKVCLQRNGVDRDLHETGALEQGPEGRDVVEAERHAVEVRRVRAEKARDRLVGDPPDRKSTRLNSVTRSY